MSDPAEFQVISDCPLCKEHSLHNMNDGGFETKQCLNCGFVTSERYKGTFEKSDLYDELPDEMKKWAKELDGYIWIPSLLTLPTGMIYPVDIDGEMKWAVAFGKEDSTGTIVYDTKNHKIYDTFDVSLFMLTRNIENKGNPKLTRILNETDKPS